VALQKLGTRLAALSIVSFLCKCASSAAVYFGRGRMEQSESVVYLVTVLTAGCALLPHSAAVAPVPLRRQQQRPRLHHAVVAAARRRCDGGSLDKATRLRRANKCDTMQRECIDSAARTQAARPIARG